jgi:hypothetical protein
LGKSRQPLPWDPLVFLATAVQIAIRPLPNISGNQSLTDQEEGNTQQLISGVFSFCHLIFIIFISDFHTSSLS